MIPGLRSTSHCQNRSHTAACSPAAQKRQHAGTPELQALSPTVKIDGGASLSGKICLEADGFARST